MKCTTCESEITQLTRVTLGKPVCDACRASAQTEPSQAKPAQSAPAQNAPAQNGPAQSVPSAPARSADGVNPTDKVTGFMCPECEEENPLRVGEIGKCQVCYCSECQGFAIDRASLGDMVEVLRAGYEGPEDLPKPIDPNEILEQTHCPACFEIMETFPYCGPGNVVIDTCEGCKLTWLDMGELGKIIRAPGRRDYKLSPHESEILKARIYNQSAADGATAMMLLARIL